MTAPPDTDEFSLIARHFAPLAADAGALGLTDDAADIIVVRGLAPDDAAERHIAVKAPPVAFRGGCAAEILRPHGVADGGRDLKRARHLETLPGCPGSFQRGDRAFYKLVGNVFVEPRLDDHDVRRGSLGAHVVSPFLAIGLRPATVSP